MSYQEIASALSTIEKKLNDIFLSKRDAIRLALIAALAGEHMVLVGPPGTAKSALIRTFAKAIDAKYFEYLLTRFSEPNELFGPIDIQAFRGGEYQRVTTGMLPEAEIVFLDEAFKANSAILNTLLSILNERQFHNGQKRINVPLISVFAASNEVPTSEDLRAVFDRFLLRVYSDHLESHEFLELIRRGLAYENARSKGELNHDFPSITATDLRHVQQNLMSIVKIPEAFFTSYKNMCFQLRSEGISLSDRRVVRFLKLFAANAFLEGRAEVDERDLFILEHSWNSIEQRTVVNDIVRPVVTHFYDTHPDAARPGSAMRVEDLVTELRLIDERLRQREQLSELQMLTYLKNLNDLRTSFMQVHTELGPQMIQRIDTILESILEN